MNIIKIFMVLLNALPLLNTDVTTIIYIIFIAYNYYIL
jgi:hypothetical protein